jgi:hypothetical protein
VTLEQIVIATATSIVIIAVIYTHSGWTNIINCYRMWFTRGYWTNYNIVEAASWITKAVIIVPGLIFGIQLWWVYFLALITSGTLIWASNKKLLPTLVGFNSLWIWLSLMVLVQHLI